GVTHERIPPKTPNKNAHIESFHSQLESDRLSGAEFENYQAAYAAVTEYITFYNQRRIHGSLYDLSPEQFMRAIANNEVQPFVVKV
ncbi:integrase core domain-containing protein, partial [Alicyclobacillus tolerans]